jgi:dipeptidyl aminopeptidase/acylaminoacyl peptidase
MARQVTEGEGDVTGPSWSPDGERLVFCRARGGPREGHVSDVWIAGADGSGARRLCAEVPSASMAAWAIGQTGRFRAAAACAPVTNLESHFGTSDSGAYVDPYDMGGEIHERREVFRRLPCRRYR